MPDHVFVSNLCVHGRHGVFAEEQRLGQKFFLDIDCEVDMTACAGDDNYETAVCYDGLCRIAQQVSDAGPFRLIESLADRIARTILERHGIVSRVSIRVRKPSAPIVAMVDHVGVEVTRLRHG
jgi:dihydroneopterin aldolase